MGTGNNYTVPAGVCTAPGQTGCTQPAADDYLDSILALKLSDGAVAWADHTLNGDLWTVPQPSGPDFVTGRAEQLLGIGQKSGVYWAVDPATGKVAWQTVVGPAGRGGNVYAGSLAAAGTDMYALDAATGKILWSFASGGSVTGASIAGGSVYWGSGYCGTACLGGSTPVTNDNKVYAFRLGAVIPPSVRSKRSFIPNGGGATERACAAR